VNKQVIRGILFAFSTSIISGFAVFLSKIAVSITDPIAHVALRTLLVAIVLTILMLLQGKLRSIVKLSKSERLKLFSIGIIGGSIPFLLFFIGLTYTSALTGNLIHKTLYIWVALLAIPFLSEKLNISQGFGYSIVLLSNVLLGSWQGMHLGKGELMILAATILWAIENVVAKKTLTTVDSLTVAWGRMSIGSLVLMVFAILAGKGPLMVSLNPMQMVALAMGSFTLLLYVLTWYKALSLAPATYVASILVLATLVTNILGWFVIVHKFPQIEINAGILSLVGVSLIVFSGKRMRLFSRKIHAAHE